MTASTLPMTTANANATAVLPNEVEVTTKTITHNSCNTSSNEEQTLLVLQNRHPVYVSGPATDVKKIDASISQLDALIEALEAVPSELSAVGSSPGFHVRGDDSFLWSTSATSSEEGLYETLDLAKNTYSEFRLPVPSPAVALKCYKKIRCVWQQRRDWAANDNSDVCSCIGVWNHCPGNILVEIANQVMEQEMVEEASECIAKLLEQRSISGDFITTRVKSEPWDRMYQPKMCPDPRRVENRDRLGQVSTKVYLIPNRNKFISTFVENALSAKASVDISTSYLFGTDAAFRYILMDIVPFIAQKNGVNVRILVDLLVIESMMVKSAFKSPVSPRVGSDSTIGSGLGESFLKNLPVGAPAMSTRASKKPKSPSEFLENLAQIYANIPGIQLKWWCARDASAGYRIKSHSKCHIFDHFSTIVGGSNIVPVVKSDSSDCDLFMSGKIVKQVKSVYDKMWNTIAFSSSPVVDQVIQSSPMLEAIKSIETTNWMKETALDNLPPLEVLTVTESTISSSVTEITPAVWEILSVEPPQLEAIPPCLENFEWDDGNCLSAVVTSESSSKGEDAILRYVLGALQGAKETIIMCFGHCNIPLTMSEALAEASYRGVSVNILINSQYSSDLRTGQSDLIRSVYQLLEVAPKVKVWSTALGSMRNGSNVKRPESCDRDLPFLHAKYVIIDGYWSAVGGWNLWSRGAFYEFDIELFFESSLLSEKLTSKFFSEVEHTSKLLTKEDCLPGGLFCPKGCMLCKGFGPFYDHVHQ